MGRTITPKYKVEVVNANPVMRSTASAWKGRATNKRLADWVRSYHESLRHDGPNAHVAEAFGADGARITYARISRNDGSEIPVAEWHS